MKQIWNSFKIAFSMYSKIPMPRSEWTKENMRYVMCFFPWIGLVIGLLTVGWYGLATQLSSMGMRMTVSFVAVILLLIPVVVTGGIHLDGLLDTSDALSSYQERERRLEILKDSHAGAFAIIICVVYFALYFGVCTMITETCIPVIALSYVLSRSLSGLSVVAFPMAKGTGLAATFSDGAQKRTVKIWMIIYMVIVGVSMIWVGGIRGIVAVVIAAIVYCYYYKMALKNFGGITGDLCGWFLQICELAIAFGVVIADMIIVSSF